MRRLAFCLLFATGFCAVVRPVAGADEPALNSLRFVTPADTAVPNLVLGDDETSGRQIRFLGPDADRVAPAPAQAVPAQTTPEQTADQRPAPKRVEADTAPPEPKPLPEELRPLREKLRRVLAIYEPRHLNTRDHTCWEVMHALIAFGVKTNIRRGGPDGEKVNAIGWLAWGNRCQNLPLVTLQGDHLFVGVGPDIQGHPGQFLGMLAQSRVRPDYPMHVNGRNFTVADLIEEEKRDCKSGTELTFKLIAMTHYLPSDATWLSRTGERWDIPRLVREEIAAPINGAACGGTHRLFGLSSAYKMRELRSEPVDGEYARAKKYITDYQKFTLTRLQNPDGSLSTEWFKYANDRNDQDRKLQTTGHMLEWLVWSLTNEQLEHPRTVKTVDFLTNLMKDNPQRKWSIGPLGHALHALVMYDERFFQRYDRTEVPAAEVVGKGASERR